VSHTRDKIKVSRFNRYLLAVALPVLLSSSFFAVSEAVMATELATESDKQESTVKNKSSYVIETLVQGSQEQPNVIYITPWQENEKAIIIQGQSLQVSLPKLMPVTPKAFKKKIRAFHQSQKVTDR